jgi:hypothetical protein
LYESYNLGTQQATLSEFQDILFKVVENFKNVFIIIDALDECAKVGEREDLLAMILNMKSRSLSSLHLLVTSRPEPDIKEALLPLLTIPAIPVEGSPVDFDIGLYVSWQLANDPKLKKWLPHIKAEIEKTLVAGANGM